MFELLVIALFLWFFVGVIRLMFKAAWGLAKALALILFILSIPTLIGCLLVASGIILLVPVGVVVIAFSLLKACV
jgi:hypothetical protein